MWPLMEAYFKSCVGKKAADTVLEILLEEMPSASKHGGTQTLLNSLQIIQSSSLVNFCSDTGGASIVNNAREIVASIHAGLCPVIVPNPTAASTKKFQESLLWLASYNVEEETLQIDILM